MNAGVEQQREREKEEELSKQQEVPPTPANSSIQVVGDKPNQNQTKSQFMVPLSGISCQLVMFWNIYYSGWFQFESNKSDLLQLFKVTVGLQLLFYTVVF